MSKSGGVLTVNLSRVELHGNQKTITGLADGPYVKLVVSDTGPGIDPAVVDRIYDPFFTTKSVGEGTGLGLSVVHGIVGTIGGAIEVQSAAETGTSFTIHLPRFEGEVEKIVPVASTIPRGTERLLVVDDEESLAQATQIILEGLGYRVTAMTSSRKALKQFQVL